MNKLEKLVEMTDNGDFEVALNFLENELSKDLKHYDYISYKILILKGLGEYDKVLKIVDEELSMPYLPNGYEEAFESVKREVESLLSGDKAKRTYFSQEELEKELLESDDFATLTQVLMQLKEYNVRKYIETVKKFLGDKTKNSMIKTLLIDILKDQEYDQEVLITKDDSDFRIIPTEIETVVESKILGRTSRILEDKLAKNPSKLEMCYQLLDVYLYDVFPNIPSDSEANEVSAAVAIHVGDMLGEEIDFTQACKEYDADLEGCHKHYRKIAFY